MQDLMVRIGFSEEEIREVLGFADKLKEKNLWQDIEIRAEEIMAVHPCSTMLGRNLEKVETLENQTNLHKYSLQMLLLLQCALRLKENYQEKNIDLRLYYESMKDLTYKMHECQMVYGVTGIFVGFWYDGFFDMTRFALGRLQFEMAKLWLEKPMLLGGYRIEHGDWTINMHIPSSGALKPKEADESFALAKRFFKEYFRDKPYVFVMASWLLDKDLMALLPEGNIKKFVKRFEVVRTSKYDIFYDGWRVFGAEWEKYKEEPENLVKSTRLQKAIADYLQQGGKLGDGYGLFVG